MCKLPPVVRFLEIQVDINPEMCFLTDLPGADLVQESSHIFALKNANGDIIASDTLIVDVTTDASDYFASLYDLAYTTNGHR